jgi:preprotein translocase subunit YajC
MTSLILLQAQPAQQSPMPTMIMFGLIAIVFYFFMLRPQAKKAREAKKFRDGLKKGDKVVTIGGAHGKVAEVADKTVLIELDSNVRVRFNKSAVAMDDTHQITEEVAKAAK